MIKQERQARICEYLDKHQFASINTLMEQISVASEEQSRGISQVGQAVTEMDGVTQQNAALVQQSAAAAASLEEQAQQLTRSISSFSLPVQA